MLEITALMDNKTLGNKALAAEHGLSMLLCYNGSRILFDCGPGKSTLDNAHKLGIDLKNLNAVVLSHAHYDHAFGYRDLIEAGLGSSRLFTGPFFFEKKYSKDGLRYSDLSCGFGPGFLEAQGIIHHQVVGRTELVPGFYLVSGFPRVYAFETIPGRFVRRTPAGFVQDTFPDEICVAAEIDGGLAVIVGCSHPGILNMVKHVQTLFAKPVKAVFGGTHLVEADSSRTEATVEALHALGVETLGLSHCSGEEVQAVIRRRGDVQLCYLGSGDCFFFD